MVQFSAKIFRAPPVTDGTVISDHKIPIGELRCLDPGEYAVDLFPPGL